MGDDTDISEIDVDDLWLREWAEEGIAACERYLARRAAFEEYLRDREEA
jgi:hypothetical protein